MQSVYKQKGGKTDSLAGVPAVRELRTIYILWHFIYLASFW